MKSIILLFLLLSAAATAPAGNSDEIGLPELHKIKKITLSPSYSCRSKQEFQKGYQQTALFLSGPCNGPDLLFNGACKRNINFFR